MSEQADLADVTEQAYRYGDALGIGEPVSGTRLDHTVMVICDSAVKPVRWYSLAAKHGRQQKRRVRCPMCGKMGTLEVVNGRG